MERQNQEGEVKASSIVLGSLMSLPLFFGTSILTDVDMAATPLSPPVGSPLDIQQQGEMEIRQLKTKALIKLNAPVQMSSVSSEDNVSQSRLEDYQEAKNWISVLEQVISREVTKAEWEIKRTARTLDGESPEKWVERMTKMYGVYPHPATQVIISEKLACDDGKQNISGCVGQDTFAGHPTAQNMQMYLTPDSIGDIYVLFHEIAHTKGILDECSADNYSRSITGLPGGHYC